MNRTVKASSAKSAVKPTVKLTSVLTKSRTASVRFAVRQTPVHLSSLTLPTRLMLALSKEVDFTTRTVILLSAQMKIVTLMFTKAAISP